jgi:putative transcriptional regulator
MGEEREHRIVVHLDALLAARGMTLAELARQVGISAVNLSVLKNGHARAIRFSTLTDICDVLGCVPGDVLTVQPIADDQTPSP